MLSLHRARAGFIKTQTAQINQIRGRLAEFGIVLPTGKVAVHNHVPTILEDAENALPDTFRQVLSRLYDHLTELSEHIEQFDQSLKAHFKHCELSQRIASLPGIGQISATAIVGTIGDGSEFKKREAAVRLVRTGSPTTLQRG